MILLVWDSARHNRGLSVSANATPSSIVVAWETKGNSTECVVEYGHRDLGRSASGTSQTPLKGTWSIMYSEISLRQSSLVPGQNWTRCTVCTCSGPPLWPVMGDNDCCLFRHATGQRQPASTKRWLNRASCHGHCHAQSELDASADFILIPAIWFNGR